MKEKKFKRRVRFTVSFLACGLPLALALWVILVFIVFEKMDYGEEELRFDKMRFEENVFFEHLPEDGTVAPSNIVLPPRVIEPNPDTHPVLPPYSSSENSRAKPEHTGK